MRVDCSLRDIDWALVGLTAAIMLLGVLAIYGASRDTIWEDAYLKQILWLGLGLICFLICSMFDYYTLVHHAVKFYVLSLLLLVMVLAAGQTLGGGRRWLPLPGGLTLQVSEFVKVVLVLLAAKFFSGLPPHPVGWMNLLKISALVAAPAFLVALQPDLSTALSFVVILVTGVFLAGLSWKQTMILGLAALLIFPLAWRQLQPYQKERLISFWEPNRDPLGSSYQVIQSKIAVGAGGVSGSKEEGSQAQLRFLPVPHTDFVFAAFAEKRGFVGVFLALALYFGLLMKIVGNARATADREGMHLCMSVAALLFFHLLVNVGMVIGYMPVTGLPLPMMSYGGSNLLATLILLGLVNNVRMRRVANWAPAFSRGGRRLTP